MHILMKKFMMFMEEAKKIIQKNIYSLAKNSMVRFVVEIDVENDTIKDHYFITRDDPNIEWVKDNINKTIKSFALENNKDFKDIAKLIRIAIVGSSNSPGIYDMMIVLGKIEVIRRFTILEI